MTSNVQHRNSAKTNNEHQKQKNSYDRQGPAKISKSLPKTTKNQQRPVFLKMPDTAIKRPAISSNDQQIVLSPEITIRLYHIKKWNNIMPLEFAKNIKRMRAFGTLTGPITTILSLCYPVIECKWNKYYLYCPVVALEGYTTNFLSMK